MSADDWVLLARLVRPQGRHGELLADLLTDFPERFADRHRVFLLKPGKPDGPREVVLERHWLHKGRVVLKLAGIDSINDAELLRGLEVAVPRAERAKLDGDALYIDQLLGCRVFDLRGSDGSEAQPDAAIEVGEVVDVDRESTAHPLLVVRSDPGKREGEILIPFVKAFLRRVDVAARRIDMVLPEGLVELNLPPTAAERQQQQAERRAELGQPAEANAADPGERG